MNTRKRSLLMAVVIVLAAIGVGLHLARKAYFDPRVPYLARDGGVEWIVFPTQPTTLTRPAAELPATFSRSFRVRGDARRATLRVQMHRAGSIELNGSVIELPGVSSWKEQVAVDVGAALVRGENRIVATVAAATGPPALWLELEGEGWSVASDATWSVSYAGSAERPARLARTPMPKWARPSAGSDVGALDDDELNPRPARALRRMLVPLAVTFAVASALVLGVRALARRRAWSWDGRGFAVLVAGIVLVQAALFVNNRELLLERGFDAPAHLEYVEHMRTHWRVPMADEGWEMYQPPLYYALAAGALELCGMTANDAGARYVLHALGWLALALQMVLVAATLRLLLGERPSAVWPGLLLAACLPMQLYLFQYVTNEGWAATAITAAVFCAVRIARRADTRALPHVVLGVVLGAALLTKFSALLAAVLIIAVLAARLVLARSFAPAVWLRTLGVALVACVAVCGWYYARVWERFGTLLVWNLDEATGFAWWQDPGYRTAGDFARFGAALERPLLCAFAGVPDALYSTLWSDGMLGGAARIDVRPPWNYDALAAGLWLALPLTILLVVGLAVALRRIVGAPRADWVLAFGLLAATAAALLSLTLALPSFAQAKSVYASSVVVALAAAFALGFGALRERVRKLAPLCECALVAWALWSVLGFWSTGAARAAGVERLPSAQHVPQPANLVRAANGDEVAAKQLARAEVERAPDQVWAWRNLAVVLIKRNDTRGAIGAARDGLAIAPWNSDLHQMLGVLYESFRELERAEQHLEWSLRLDPSAAPNALRLAQLHVAAAEPEAARRVLERTLAALRDADLARRAELEAALAALGSDF